MVLNGSPPLTDPVTRSEVEARIGALDQRVDDLHEDLRSFRAEVRHDLRSIQQSLQHIVAETSRLEERVPKAPPKRYQVLFTGLAGLLAYLLGQLTKILGIGN